MTIFDFLTMLGGVCIFLFGMNVMGNALERAAGNKLRDLLGKLTTNKLAGFLTGLGVTAIIQSSGATTVMVVGFVNSGLMTLKQAINVIIGSNIGTTVTAWILSLSGISGSNPWVQMFKPTSFTPILALVGIILYMFSKGGRKKDIGTVLLGFATLMFGMNTMSDAVAGLKDVPEFCELFVLFKNPLLGVLVGAVLTTIMQSSSASVGILQALTVTGAVSYGAAIPIILGQNIGSCTTSLISCAGANKNAKRAAVVHLLFNVIGTGIFLIVYAICDYLINIPILDQSATGFGIAISHTAFNVICTIVMLPVSGLLEKLVLLIIPENKTPDKNVQLDERLFTTPPLALAQSRTVACQMAERAIKTLKDGMLSLSSLNQELKAEILEGEEETDKYEDILGTYLVKLSALRIGAKDSREAAMLLRAIGDFERISDHGVNILESAEELRDKGIEFSPEAKEELKVMIAAVTDILDMAKDAFSDNDIEKAFAIESLEEVVDDIKDTLRMRHIDRLQQSNCSIEAGFVWADLLTNLERVADHCSNIAGGIIDYAHGDRSTHESLRTIKATDDVFAEKFAYYKDKYALPVGSSDLQS